MKVDMHLHTRGSYDCLTDPERVLECAAARGVDVVCVTDHDTIETAVALQARYPQRVIVGEEVKTAEGVDIIGLFMREAVPRHTPAVETCRRIREQGALVYVPHPFAPGKGGGGAVLQQIAEWIDAFEGFNGRIHDPALNQRAVDWARARDLPLGAGSDAHTPGEVARAYVEMPDAVLEPGAFLDALRQGTIHGRSASWLVHAASTYAKWRKRLW